MEVQQIDYNKKKYDTYVNIITNILSVFIAFVIVFTLKIEYWDNTNYGK